MPLASAADAALETLLLPFASGHLPRLAGALFLRARMGAALCPGQWPNLICEQSFKPDADALQRSGFTAVSAECSGVRANFPLVLVLPPRQREEARALMARAITATRPGGIVVAAMQNNEGARSTESDFIRLVGPVTTLVKNKCRVFWKMALDDSLNRPLVNQWLALDAPRPITDGRFLSRPGIFAWNRIDSASRLLAHSLPSTLAGEAADLGAGFGYLATELLTRCPRINSLDLYEAESRALDLARHNLASFTIRVPIGYHWHDVTSGLPSTYDVIVTNPPFHTQRRTDRPDIGRRFLSVAANALRPGGSLWLVANRHLPYEAVLKERFATITTIAIQDGFKVIAASQVVR